MLMADVFAISLSVIGFLLSLLGLWLLCRALWPRRVEAAAGRCRNNGVACFLTGVPITFMAALVGAGLGKRFGAPGQLMAFVVAFSYVMYAGAGMAGLVTHLGRRLESPVDAARSWRATLRGGIALEMAYLLPLLGWFGLLPISFVLGSGAMTLSFFGAGKGSGVDTAAQLESADEPTRHAGLPAIETAGGKALL